MARYCGTLMLALLVACSESTTGTADVPDGVTDACSAYRPAAEKLLVETNGELGAGVAFVRSDQHETHFRALFGTLMDHRQIDLVVPSRESGTFQIESASASNIVGGDAVSAALRQSGDADDTMTLCFQDNMVAGSFDFTFDAATAEGPAAGELDSFAEGLQGTFGVMVGDPNLAEWSCSGDENAAIGECGFEGAKRGGNQ